MKEPEMKESEMVETRMNSFDGSCELLHHSVSNSEREWSSAIQCQTCRLKVRKIFHERMHFLWKLNFWILFVEAFVLVSVWFTRSPRGVCGVLGGFALLPSPLGSSQRNSTTTTTTALHHSAASSCCEVATATIATTPKNTAPTTFRCVSGFALPSVIHNNQLLL